MRIKGLTHEYQLVIGLEVHAQLDTKNKLFSSSENEFNSIQNKNICFFDLAFPGQLPVINYEIIELVVKFALAINADIAERSYFDRKHYFYPDLPSGYQITQFFNPVIKNGKIQIDSVNHSNQKIEREIKIERAHIEQDAGKLIHDKYHDFSCVDYNRSNVPLLEIVTAPDFRSIDEVILYLETLQEILRTTKVCLADLEKGTFRCDVNISLGKIPLNNSQEEQNSDSFELGTRCEIKNLNSFRFIRKAIEYEFKRQFDILESGKEVEQETRLFNTKTGTTEVLRNKENALDYRYFPDPDLPSLLITKEFINKIKEEMPELPSQKKKRYLSCGISEKESKFLCSELNCSLFFDAVFLKCGAKLSSTWVLNELNSRLSKIGRDFSNSPVSSERLISLIDLINSNKINNKIAKDVLDIMLEDKREPLVIVEEKGLMQVISADFIDKIAKDVILKNEKQIQEYKNGNEKIMAFLIGQGMKLAEGKANPQDLSKKIKEIINKEYEQ